ncbi:MAG: SUMF1/EgtB/PvdO family nonheme iron enzyme, partial [Candidatus Brocadiae bacterium]|nr:SUMF1/EgtB/PvdO family nonheme iron enzyme [Candidatus Brocadiia bacterium]
GYLKPSDILLTVDQTGRPLPKVALFDLGLSAEQSVVSLPGEGLGTPKYMAPEVIQGRPPTAQADIFALGVIAYELFTGQEPFPSDHVIGYLFANCQHEQAPLDQVSEHVPHEIALVVGRMLEKDPGRRYRSMQRVIDDLDRCTESIKMGRVEVVPYGTDSAFARDYQLPEPKPTQPSAPAVSGARAVLLVVALAAVGALGYLAGRTGPEDAGRGARQPHRAEPAQPTGLRATPAQQVGTTRQAAAAAAFQKATADWERLSKREDFDLGLARFREVERKYADTPFAARSRDQMALIHTEWAHALAQEGDYEGVVAQYAQAIEVAPEGSEYAKLAQRKMPAAMVDLAESAKAAGRYDRAIELYEDVALQYSGTMEAALLSTRKSDILLNKAFVAWKDEKDYDNALGIMLDIIRDYAETEAAPRAKQAIPALYLDAIRQKLDKGELQEARRQLAELTDAYPDHEIAAKAAELDAETLLLLLVRHDEAGEAEVSAARYGELLTRHPNSAWTVRAARRKLALEPEPGRALLYDDNTARRQIAQAKEHYDQLDLPRAIAVLKGVIRFARVDSPLAASALATLPEWLYESAVHSYGGKATAECEKALEELRSQFPGGGWEARCRATLEAVKDAPDGMVYVPEGRFWMGTDMSGIEEILDSAGLLDVLGSQLGVEDMEQIALIYGILNETPKHLARTEAFYVDTTEVTNEQYKQYLDATGNPPPSHWRDGTYAQGEGSLPMVNISFDEAHAYAAWRGARLPTEAEWEKAARGVSGRTFPWGEVFTQERCHHMRTQDTGPAAVGSYPTWSSPYGCLDMIGNVHEWTSAAFAAYPGSKAEDVPEEARKQVVRGGAWYQQEIAPIPARCASRYPMDPTAPNMATGFRCVRDISEPAAATSGANP